jgi:hypothetical protein
MKKAHDSNNDSDMREEYDFSKGVRGKYAGRFSENTVMVVLNPDVAEIFPDSASVNSVLRALAHIIRERSQKASA